MIKRTLLSPLSPPLFFAPQKSGFFNIGLFFSFWGGGGERSLSLDRLAAAAVREGGGRKRREVIVVVVGKQYLLLPMCTDTLSERV